MNKTIDPFDFLVGETHKLVPSEVEALPNHDYVRLRSFEVYRRAMEEHAAEVSSWKR